MSNLSVSQITNGTTTINTENIPPDKGYYSRQTITQVDTTSRSSVSTAWTLGPTFSTITDLQPNSLLLLTFYVPTRNDSTSWGGGYIEPQVSFNSGTWQSLGSCGHDAGVMRLRNATIGNFYNTILLDPAQSSTFTAQFRFYFRSYDGTIGWNNGINHDINVVSGTAPIMSGNNGLQHYMHLIVEELAVF